MLYTVSDIFRTYGKSLRLSAGADGLARPVTGVAILDYEFIPTVKNKYRRVNFRENEIVLTTFLYAQNDPYLITDAVKQLVEQGASGLVVKNALHVPIPAQAMRYADARDFPLLLVTSDDLFFDTMILQIGQRIAELKSSDFAQREIDALLQAESSEEVRRRALRLNPSFCYELAALYLTFDRALGRDDFRTLEAAFRKRPESGCEHLLACYNGGLLLVASGDGTQELNAQAFLQALEETVELCGIRARITGRGASNTQFGLEACARAIAQALDASQVSQDEGGSFVRYVDLGVLGAVLPFAQTDEMQSFAEGVFAPLREFDAEHGAHLEETLVTFANNEGNVARTAEALGQHANTVRYRLDKISAATGLDWHSHAGAEQLFFACHINQAAKVRAALR